MKFAIKNLSLGLGLMLSLLVCSALPMNSGTQLKDKLDNLNNALGSLQGGLQKLSTQLGTLKGKLGGSASVSGGSGGSSVSGSTGGSVTGSTVTLTADQIEAARKAAEEEAARQQAARKAEQEAHDREVAERIRLAEEERLKKENEAKQSANNALASMSDTDIEDLTKTALKPDLSEILRKGSAARLNTLKDAIKKLKNNMADEATQKEFANALNTAEQLLDENSALLQNPLIKFIQTKAANDQKRAEEKRQQEDEKRQREKEEKEALDKKKREEAAKKKLEEAQAAEIERRKGLDFSNKIDYLTMPMLGDGQSAFEKFYQYFMKSVFNPFYTEWANKEPGERDYRGFANSDYYTNMEDYIGRAYFEKGILDKCRDFINVNDPYRIMTESDSNWVYNNYLKEIIDRVCKNESTDADKVLLNNIAENVAQAVRDMWYHLERDPINNHVDCGCVSSIFDRGLDNRHHQRYDSLSGLYKPTDDFFINPGEGIPLDIVKYPLRYPISYLIFETMHITLNHGYFLTNPLIKLFNFEKDIKAEVVIENKTEFRIGFDGSFDSIMDVIVPPDAGLDLVTEVQKDYKDKEILLKDKTGQMSTRMIITGKKIGHSICNWSQGSGHTCGQYVTDKELLFAIKMHLDRHSCYSVGLIPYDVVRAFPINEEQDLQITQIEFDAQINIKEKERLQKKINGLVRIPKIVEYLAQGCKAIDLSKSLGIAKTKFNALLRNLSTKLESINLESIQEDEWKQVFEKLKQGDDYEEKIKPFFENDDLRDSLVEAIKNDKMKPERKPGQKQLPTRPVSDVMYEAFENANK